ncbi:MAG: SufE family protein [Spirochaeta sp.]|jgi:cysteine desulfuration protein SufE|nr:SufE family protein [Spirochaeta sp.]
MREQTLADMKEFLRDATEELLMMREMDNLEMYRVITDKGKELEGISEDERTDDNFVYGCVSNVYIADELEDGRMHYRGASEAHVVRGLLAYMVEALNGLRPEDVVSGTREVIEQFAEDVDLKTTLTPNRANAFGNIYALMVEKAAARAASS